MKTLPQLFALCSLFFAVTAVQAQWKTETYALKAGWNAIYLHGDATYASPDVLFAAGEAANIEEVWRWNPNPSEIQFTETPLITSAGTPEWAVWVRGAAGNTLNTLKGQSGYLVKCSSAQASYEVTILQQALPPSATWMRTGANLLGFPAKTVGINANGTAGTPKFADYFATFPAAIAANTEIYKYVGGELGQDNPMTVFSPTMETLDRNKAYWFSSQVVGDFYAPISIELSNLDGIAFGNAGSVVTALLSNRTASAVTLTLNHKVSETAPAGQTAVTAQVPLTRGSLEGLNWVYTDLQTGVNDTVLIGPRSTVEVRFGIDRAGSMTATAVGSYFASLLQVTDSGNLMDVYLPVSATKSSLAGLWAGDIEVTRVDSRVAADGRATAEVTVDGSGVVTGVAVSDGGFGYDVTPTVVVPSTDGLTLGMSVSGTGLTAGATITSIIDGTHLKLSQDLPAGTVSLVFGETTLSSTGANTTTITVGSTSGLTAGMTVVGPGISGTATIVSIFNGTQLVLSQNIPEATNVLDYGDVTAMSSITTILPSTETIITVPSTSGMVVNGNVFNSDDYVGIIVSILSGTQISVIRTSDPGTMSAYPAQYLPNGTSSITIWSPGFSSQIYGGNAECSTPPSATIAVSSTAGLAAGLPVTGPDLVGDVTISSITDATHMVLSQSIAVGARDLSYGFALNSTSRADTHTVVTVSSTAGLAVGMSVTGPGITGTATIVSIIDATTFVLSQAIPAGTNDLVYVAIVLASQVVSPTPLSVVIAAPPGSAGSQATATASVSNGAITGFTITDGGSGYAVPPAQTPQVTITAPLSGAVPRPFPLRMLLHVADDGTARMLSQVFMGNLDGGGTELGLCTKEAGLNSDQKASAMRIAVAHLPLDQVIDGSSPGTNTGSVVPGSALVRTVVIAHDAPTNPFLHQYHPDHDSRDARPDGTDVPLGDGVESYAVTRTCTFTFSVTPPSGVSSIGWGANVIGGTYSEIFRGLHRDALITSGTFILRRVSEIGAITIND